MPDRHSQDDSTPDRDLITQTAAGDRRAFERLVERHAAAVLRLATAIDREVLILRDVEGLRGPEAAEVLGMGEQALKSRLQRARLRLAVALRDGREQTLPLKKEAGDERT